MIFQNQSIGNLPIFNGKKYSPDDELNFQPIVAYGRIHMEAGSMIHVECHLWMIYTTKQTHGFFLYTILTHRLAYPRILDHHLYLI
jgi:hypothetical protein